MTFPSTVIEMPFAHGSRDHRLKQGLNNESSQIAELVVVLQTLEVFLFDELIDGFLDILDLGCETRLDLRDGLLHQYDVLHLLARLHDANNRRLAEC